jgi:hypothetical protein
MDFEPKPARVQSIYKGGGRCLSDARGLSFQTSSTNSALRFNLYKGAIVSLRAFAS